MTAREGGWVITVGSKRRIFKSPTETATLHQSS